MVRITICCPGLLHKQYTNKRMQCCHTSRYGLTRTNNLLTKVQVLGQDTNWQGHVLARHWGWKASELTHQLKSRKLILRRAKVLAENAMAVLAVHVKLAGTSCCEVVTRMHWNMIWDTQTQTCTTYNKWTCNNSGMRDDFAKNDLASQTPHWKHRNREIEKLLESLFSRVLLYAHVCPHMY